MKRFLFAIVIAAAACVVASAEGSEADGLGLGYSVGERGGDFSVGVEATSPCLLSGHLAFRAAGEVLWKEGVPLSSSEETWKPYYLARLGALVRARTEGPFRLYGEFGGACIFPIEELCASTTAIPAIYGLFGFELPVADGSPGCYFIELGSTGVFGAGADLMSGEPMLAHGFAARAGFRWFF